MINPKMISAQLPEHLAWPRVVLSQTSYGGGDDAVRRPHQGSPPSAGPNMAPKIHFMDQNTVQTIYNLPSKSEI